MIDPCPCGSGLDYPTCCEPRHDGSAPAETAEALMRSRYSAYAVGDAGYLRRTWHPSTRPADVEIDPDLTWTGLEILNAVDGSPQDSTGTVEFRAHHRHHGVTDTLHERSTFTRRAGRWVYLDGTVRPRPTTTSPSGSI